MPDGTQVRGPTGMHHAQDPVPRKSPLTANRRQGGLDCLCGAVWIMNPVIQILEEGGWGDSLPSADNLPVC